MSIQFSTTEMFCIKNDSYIKSIFLNVSYYLTYNVQQIDFFSFIFPKKMHAGTEKMPGCI